MVFMAAPTRNFGREKLNIQPTPPHGPLGIPWIKLSPKKPMELTISTFVVLVIPILLEIAAT